MYEVLFTFKTLISMRLGYPCYNITKWLKTNERLNKITVFFNIGEKEKHYLIGLVCPVQYAMLPVTVTTSWLSTCHIKADALAKGDRCYIIVALYNYGFQKRKD